MSDKAKFDYSQPISGRIWLLGDDIDTDLIVPSRVLTEADPKKQIDACLENILPDFAKNVKKGDFIIAGKNFGCGSSREEAVFVLKELGIAAIIAKSFARIFYRNMINLGLPPIEIPDLEVNPITNKSTFGKKGEELKVDVLGGIIMDQEGDILAEIVFFPEFIQRYLQFGGAIPYLQKTLNTGFNSSCDK